MIYLSNLLLVILGNERLVYCQFEQWQDSSCSRMRGG